MPVISLLTDFGVADTYVGQMKAAMLSLAPTLALVDLTHAVAPQDIRGGAFLLWTAVLAFPPGSVHLAVVDPGVGSSRAALAVRTQRGDYLVGPDNGLLIPAAERLGGIAAAVELNVPEGASHTFHGRDVFAPAAARLAAGVALAELGRPATIHVPLRISTAREDVGEVLHVDTYGNLVTNFPAERLPDDFEVRLGDEVIPFAPYYAAVKPGALLALVGSSGLLEISVRDGSAAERTGARVGTPVRISRRRPRG